MLKRVTWLCLISHHDMQVRGRLWKRFKESEEEET